MKLRPHTLPLRLALWVFTLAIFPIPPSVLGRSFEVEVLESKLFGQVDCGALSLESSRFMPAFEAPALHDRVGTRLLDARDQEPEPWFNDDYQIAFLTVRYAQGEGVKFCTPHVLATVEVLGCHPDQVWPRIVARRKAKLGRFYSAWYDEWDNRRPSDLGDLSAPVKKLGRSVTLEKFQRQSNAA
jgi:hypothetical protein